MPRVHRAMILLPLVLGVVTVFAYIDTTNYRQEFDEVIDFGKKFSNDETERLQNFNDVNNYNNELEPTGYKLATSSQAPPFWLQMIFFAPTAILLILVVKEIVLAVRKLVHLAAKNSIQDLEANMVSVEPPTSITVVSNRMGMLVAEASEHFSDYLECLRIGHWNSLQATVEEIPSDMLMETLEELVAWAYGNGNVQEIETMRSACILVALDALAMCINNTVLDMLPGEVIIFKSIDRCWKRRNGFGTDLPTSLFNKQMPSWMPPHELRLKPGCVVVCLDGLNMPAGARFRVDKIEEETIHCTLLTTPQAGNQYQFTKLELQPAEMNVQLLHAFVRKQFPLRLAYSLTVNKAQGQALSKVGIVLDSSMLKADQFYTALSHVSSWKNVRIWQDMKKR